MVCVRYPVPDPATVARPEPPTTILIPYYIKSTVKEIPMEVMVPMASPPIPIPPPWIPPDKMYAVVSVGIIHPVAVIPILILPIFIIPAAIIIIAIIVVDEMNTSGAQRYGD
jgi:hypothetical protein